MMGVSSALIENRYALLRLSKLNNQISSASEAINNLVSLSQLGILSEDEAKALAQSYKSAIRDHLTQELSQSKEIGILLSSASLAETEDKMGKLTPIIAATPVLTNTTPAELLAESTLILADATKDLKELNSIINNINNLIK